MQVVIRSTAADAALLTARVVAKAIRAKPSIVLGMATGRTMEAVYAELVRMHRKEGLDFSQVKTFNLDEYAGLTPEDPNSYRFYMNKHLFKQVNIDLKNTFIPNGAAPDLDAECARYEEQIKKAGGIDLQLLGIGTDGHIGFNEPLSALLSRTRVETLTPATREQNSGMFGGDPEKVPMQALTMGVGTIQDSRRCILLATGASKSAILAKAVEGPITAMVTASALQMHPHCTVIADEDAASSLREIEHYRAVFAYAPEWKDFR